MKHSKELIVGLSLAAAVVVFALGIRFLQDVPLFRSTYVLYTHFESAGGLSGGSPIRINGVDVGAVENVRLDTDNRVRVRLHLDDNVHIPEGSHAEIGGIAALGSNYVVVFPGPPGNPPIPGDGYIEGISSPDAFEAVTERSVRLTENVEEALASANVLLEDTGLLIGETGADIRPTLRALREVTDALAQTLREEQQSVKEIISNVEIVSEDLARISGTSADTLAQTLHRLDQITMYLEGSLKTLEGATQNLDEILEKINNGEGTIARLLNDPTLYIQMGSTLGALDALLQDLQDNPRKYLRHMDIVDVF